MFAEKISATTFWTIFFSPKHFVSVFTEIFFAEKILGKRSLLRKNFCRKFVRRKFFREQNFDETIFGEKTNQGKVFADIFFR